MLVTQDLVFVHIPRTGGSFIRSVLGAHLPADSHAPPFATHARYGELPKELRDRPAFCVVRNPWDWYVSWYHNVMKHGTRLRQLSPDDPKREIWDTVFRRGRSSFAEAVTRACEGELDDPLGRSARKHDMDLYSAYVRTQGGIELKRGYIEVGRFEELVPFLVEFLDDRSLLTDELRDALEGTAAVNASQHTSYRDYYDDELREIVGYKARLLTERFGYRFEQEPELSSTTRRE
jgi:hypothetical protein